MKNAQDLRKRNPAGKNLVAIDGTLDKVELIRVTVQEKGRNAEPFELRIMHKDAVRERVVCSNPQCFNGGFSLGDLLRDMTRDRQEEFIGVCFCTGQHRPLNKLATASDIAGAVPAHKLADGERGEWTGQEGDPEEEGPHPSCTTRYDVQAVLRFKT